MLADKFGIPVFINNDGDLFVYGETIAGLLPHINGLLEKAGSPKRYRNLFGVTLGTGFGGGIVRNGELFIGDNSMAGEVWLLRNKLDPGMNAEEGACIRAVKRAYADFASIPFDQVGDPRQIAGIAMGLAHGDREAALASYRRLGVVAGDAMGNALTLIDGLAVIGGGIANAYPLFLPSLVEELNSNYQGPGGNEYRRLASQVFNLEEASDLDAFLAGETREIRVPGTSRTVSYDPLQRLGVGISRLGTSEAVAVGAYSFALQRLDRRS
jgi:glucokinase